MIYSDVCFDVTVGYHIQWVLINCCNGPTTLVYNYYTTENMRALYNVQVMVMTDDTASSNVSNGYCTST